MKLYYKAGACSLASHIVMAELNMVYEIEAVDIMNKTCASGDFKLINPKGAVPALRMENNEILTEGAVILQYLADQKPEANMMPKLGTTDRYRCMEWLNFIATDVHKNFSPLFGSAVKNPEGLNEQKEGAKAILRNKIAYVSEKLGNNTFLMGETFTVADAYLFTCLTWGKFVGLDFSQWSNVMSYMNRVSERPAVMRAMKEEGLLK